MRKYDVNTLPIRTCNLKFYKFKISDDQFNSDWCLN
jgi:hypothetical protein